MKRKIGTLYIDGLFSGKTTCFREVRKYLKEEKGVNIDDFVDTSERFILKQNGLFSKIYSELSSGLVSMKTVVEHNVADIVTEKQYNFSKGSAFIILLNYEQRTGGQSPNEMAWQVTELTELLGLDFNVIQVIPGETILDVSERINNLLDSKYQF